MKRAIAAMLAFALLVGCSGKAPNSSAKSSSTVESSAIETAKLVEETVSDKEITLSLSFGKRSGTYTGSLVNDLPDGFGTFLSKNLQGEAWKYTGNWTNGHFSGKGESVFLNAEGGETRKEVGEYKKDYIVNGKLYLDGVLAYEGQFRLGKYEGNGKYYINDNVFYEGQFKADAFDGEGKMYDAAGNITFSGNFVEGLPDKAAFMVATKSLSVK